MLVAGGSGETQQTMAGATTVAVTVEMVEVVLLWKLLEQFDFTTNNGISAAVKTVKTV